MLKPYIEIIALNHPEYDVSAEDDTFEGVNWNSPSTIIPQTQLDNERIEEYKISKIRELSTETNQLIINGFYSNALDGTNWRVYDSGEVDQLNLIGAIQVAETIGGSIAYASRINKTDVQKTYNDHTNIQLRTVLAHGAQVKSNELLKFNIARSKVDNINITTDIESAVFDIDAIML